MRTIAVLDKTTIDKIAAGEVVERPASVVKELVENAIDAGASAITVEIKEGGISFIRITDNGSGIPMEQVPLAFLRHATSKIQRVEDLTQIVSLGFRGEALSSIAAVAQVELITKTSGEITGTRYVIEGGSEKALEEVGAPEGTTFIVRNLFYNTPARAKFLKTAATEGGYVGNLVEHLALSHPDISFKYMYNGQTKLHTSGSHNLKELVYNIYGRDIAKELLEVHGECGLVTIGGFIGKPVISRGNRNYENYYVNGRYVKSKLLSKAIEDGYGTSMMQHKYPFTLLYLTLDGEHVDVNVHPTKMELRFSNQDEIYRFLVKTIASALQKREQIVEAALEKSAVLPKPAVQSYAEPFEVERRRMEALKVKEQPSYQPKPELPKQEHSKPERSKSQAPLPVLPKQDIIKPEAPKQMELFSIEFLTEEARKSHRIIGQVFDTYWLVQFEDKLYIIDQHAAHEKVLYERIMKEFENRQVAVQLLSPPLIVTLQMQEAQLLEKYKELFISFGFEIEAFGGKEYQICAVPASLYGIASEALFLELLDSLGDIISEKPLEVVTHRLATMACKAAVKGNQKISQREAEALIDELLTLENPYQCPHGRPTIISMSKYELEKKFKRIV